LAPRKFRSVRLQPNRGRKVDFKWRRLIFRKATRVKWLGDRCRSYKPRCSQCRWEAPRLRLRQQGCKVRERRRSKHRRIGPERRWGTRSSASSCRDAEYRLHCSGIRSYSQSDLLTNTRKHGSSTSHRMRVISGEGLCSKPEESRFRDRAHLRGGTCSGGKIRGVRANR
jgi:hypothetical protein